jgi:predicted DCC family thiol-disulfide oxidoreductase YuxK
MIVPSVSGGDSPIIVFDAMCVLCSANVLIATEM